MVRIAIVEDAEKQVAQTKKYVAKFRDETGTETVMTTDTKWTLSTIWSSPLLISNSRSR